MSYNDGLNSTYANQSTRNVINYEYQLQSARSAEKQRDFSNVVSMKKNEIQIRPANKARKPLKTQRPPKVGVTGRVGGESKEYFNNRKKSNYIMESSRGSTGMRNQGQQPQKSRNKQDKTNPQNTYGDNNIGLSKKMS